MHFLGQFLSVCLSLARGEKSRKRRIKSILRKAELPTPATMIPTLLHPLKKKKNWWKIYRNRKKRNFLILLFSFSFAPLKIKLGRRSLSSVHPRATDRMMSRVTKREGRASRVGGWISISPSSNRKTSLEGDVQFTCKFSTKFSQIPCKLHEGLEGPLGPCFALDEKRGGPVPNSNI